MPLMKSGVGSLRAHRLHHDRREPLAVLGDDRLDLVELVEVERMHQPGEAARHALGVEARQQMAVERGGLAEIGAEIPVVPAVIAAERHHVAAGGGARDADRDRHGLAAGAAEAHHVRPGMQFDQQFGELDILGAVQRRHRAHVDRGLHRGVDVGIGKAEDGGADAAIAHVEIGLAVEVDDLGALGRLEIGRPLLGQEHFGRFDSSCVPPGMTFRARR